MPELYGEGQSGLCRGLHADASSGSSDGGRSEPQTRPWLEPPGITVRSPSVKAGAALLRSATRSTFSALCSEKPGERRRGDGLPQGVLSCWCCSSFGETGPSPGPHSPPLQCGHSCCGGAGVARARTKLTGAGSSRVTWENGCSEHREGSVGAGTPGLPAAPNRDRHAWAAPATGQPVPGGEHGAAHPS